jgi:hypothetical protein
MPLRKPSRHDRFRPQGRQTREIGAPDRLRVVQDRRVAELLSRAGMAWQMLTSMVS